MKALPDGNLAFTSQENMQVKKYNLGFGERTWRYAIAVDDTVVTDVFIEDGKMDDSETDPFGVSSAENVYETLKKKWS